MERLRTLRLRGSDLREDKAALDADSMKIAKRRGAWRLLFMLCSILCLLGFAVVSLVHLGIQNEQLPEWTVSPDHRKLVHEHVKQVLKSQCRPSSARKGFLARLSESNHVTEPFLWKNGPLPSDLFQYHPPFGLSGLQRKVQDLLQQLPDSDAVPKADNTSDGCRRCVVMGNGGILKGLQLGSLIDRFDTIIRLNSGPLGEYSVDVGNRTSIRMSYPEGTPVHWVDTDKHTLFVAVLYKGFDISWTSAMIKKHRVPLLDWLFFWQKVPDQIPLEANAFRLLNPLVIRETALDLLKYPPPTPRLWGWDQNVPTLGVSALNLASLLCDEVSLAGFGYNLVQQGAPLHYYDHLPMTAMLQQKMHNVNRETQLLQSLVREGTVTDLTGGIHCPFCPT